MDAHLHGSGWMAWMAIWKPNANQWWSNVSNIKLNVAIPQCRRSLKSPDFEIILYLDLEILSVKSMHDNTYRLNDRSIQMPVTTLLQGFGSRALETKVMIC